MKPMLIAAIVVAAAAVIAIAALIALNSGQGADELQRFRSYANPEEWEIVESPQMNEAAQYNITRRITGQEPIALFRVTDRKQDCAVKFKNDENAKSNPQSYFVFVKKWTAQDYANYSQKKAELEGCRAECEKACTGARKLNCVSECRTSCEKKAGRLGLDPSFDSANYSIYQAGASNLEGVASETESIAGAESCGSYRTDILNRLKRDVFGIDLNASALKRLD